MPNLEAPQNTGQLTNEADSHHRGAARPSAALLAQDVFSLLARWVGTEQDNVFLR